MNKVIVVTTIRPPTDAMKAWMKIADEQGWDLVVVGDKKTDHAAWQKQGSAHYLAPQGQLNTYHELAQAIPWNHYARKNLGYIYAIKNLKADVIFETDDDNFPLPTPFADVAADGTNFKVFGHFTTAGSQDVGFFNVFEQMINYEAGGFAPEMPIWPRGYPMTRLRDVDATDFATGNIESRSSLMRQYMCNGEPDRCATQRLTYGMIDVEFDYEESYVLDQNVWCPFNTQSTLTFKNAFDLLYIPWTPPGRCTDIIRGWIAQRLLWERDSHLSFHGPVVRQERNEHDLLADLSEEVPLYCHTEVCLGKLLQGKVHDLGTAYSRVVGPWVTEDEFATIELWKDAVK